MIDALVLPVIAFKPHYIPLPHGRGAVRGRLDVQRRFKAGHIRLRMCLYRTGGSRHDEYNRTDPSTCAVASRFLFTPPASCLGGNRFPAWTTEARPASTFIAGLWM